MSDGEPFWPGSREVEALVGRAVAECVDPLRGQLTALARALAILADRVPRPQQVEELTSRVEALTQQVEGALASAQVGVAGRNAQTDDLRRVLSAAVDEAVTRARATTGVEVGRLYERLCALEASVRAGDEGRDGQTDDLRQALAVAVGHAVAKLDQTRSVEVDRLLERIGKLEASLRQDDDLRGTLTDAVEQAVGRALARVEASHTASTKQTFADIAGLLREADGRQITALVARAEAAANRRDEQAAALLSALDERLQALHIAGTHAGEDREERLARRLEAIPAEHGQVLPSRIDERTAAIAELSAIPSMVAAAVQDATAAALGAQVEPLVARLVEAVDSLAHEGGRIEAIARGHAGEARAVEERVTAMFVEVAERAESAVDRSRAHIAEGQVALGGRFEAIVGELMSALNTAAQRLEARLAESTESLRAAGGHQNGALLDAVTLSSQQLAEGLAEVRTALVATGTEAAGRSAEAERRATALGDRIEALLSTVESIGHDPRLDALVVEQVAAREAQLAAIEAVSIRLDEVGPMVARALLTEVERAVRAAKAAEEAASSLRPDALRAALSQASNDAAAEMHAATRRFDEAIAALADQIGQQAVLREAVQDVAHKAELTAIDIRGLRDRLTPHLVALAEATTRRAEADQAGFDAVLARLDQLLAHHIR